MNSETLFEVLCRAGCATDNHESDLYVRLDDKARAVLRESGHAFTTFRSQIDGEIWAEVPFAYAPYWEARQ